MRALNAGVIASGVIALYLSALCAVEDLGLGGWAKLFLVLGSAQVGLGAFGIFATYFHIWLLFYLFAMAVLWLVAIWLALFLPGYYTVLWANLESDAISGGLQQRFFATADPSSREMSTLSRHECINAPFDQWHPACRGVLVRYVEQELHLNLWHSQWVCGVFLLILGSIFSYLTVGPRTAVDVLQDGARYMQGSAAVTWACVTLYWYFFLDWDWGGFMASILFGSSIALCVVPCCISSGSEEVRLRGRRSSPRGRLKWWRPQFTGRCGVLTYALLAVLAIMAAVYCLGGQEDAGKRIRSHFGQFCDEDCQAELEYTLRAECESRQDADAQVAAAAQETIQTASDGEGRRRLRQLDQLRQRGLAEVTDDISDPCHVTATQVQERFVEDKKTQLDKVGWTMVFVAEVEVLQCVCFFYKSWVARTRRRQRAGAPYRESSI
eukprot:COSAG02_NODE_670_length_18676_cov_29.852029_3_plen_438_part_00